MGSAPKVLEQIAGGLLVCLILVDVFLTVLYARIGTGILSPRLARAVWYVFRLLACRAGSRRGKVLSVCGPTILVLLLGMWALGLTLGTALILHPHLGKAITSSSGKTDTGFITALFAGGSSIAIVGASNYTPQSGWFKLFYLFNSLVGMSVVSLTLTYLMQIYTALQRRNSAALSVHIGSGKIADAAKLLAGIGPQGRFETGITVLAGLADDLANVKEAHHFYPVLFYFRFEQPFYSVSRMTTVALDTVTLIRAALDNNHYRWFIDSGAVSDTWESSMLLLRTLEEAFLGRDLPEPAAPDPDTRDQWRRRFWDAVRTLHAANIDLAPNLELAADTYVALRSQWNPHISNLGPSMLYSSEEIDPASTRHLQTSETIRMVA
jgi:hypothetical protein